MLFSPRAQSLLGAAIALPFPFLSRGFGVRSTTRTLGAVVVALVFPCASVSFAQPEKHRIYFGNLHAHTSYSDGSGTPGEAYQYSKVTGGLDFLAITEHNHRTAEKRTEGTPTGERGDGRLIGKTPALYDQLIQSAEDRDAPGSFITLWGQEFSTIGSGNHVNLFAAEKVIDDQVVRNGDFKKLYEEWIPDHQEVRICQFNHPWDGKNKSTNYGLDDYEGSISRLRDASKCVRLIEVINGPGTKNQKGLKAKLKGESYYRYYLSRGFRVAPTADQDNHYRTWGRLTDARTGVLAHELSRSAISEALGARRCFASTDKNLRLWYWVKEAVMGSEVTASDRTLLIRFEIEDPDEDNAHYRVNVVYGDPNSPDSAFQKELERFQGNHAATHEFRTDHDSTFLYLKVVQWPSQEAETDYLLSSPVWVSIQ